MTDLELAEKWCSGASGAFSAPCGSFMAESGSRMLLLRHKPADAALEVCADFRQHAERLPVRVAEPEDTTGPVLAQFFDLAQPTPASLEKLREMYQVDLARLGDNCTNCNLSALKLRYVPLVRAAIQ